jgi:hypothetical protein
MPLQKLQFRPGVNREGTTLANEGGWFDCDKVRFRSGYPEKIGGWAALSYNTFLGVCRSLWNWVTLKSYNLMGVGTNLKFYIEDGGTYYDVTPIRETTTNPSGQITLAITSGSNLLTITDANADLLQDNDFVTLTGATTLGGNVTAAVLNQEFQIVQVLSGTQYRVQLSVTADTTASSSTMTGLTIAYQINTGFATFTVGTGWGAGPWSRGTWGSGYSTGFGFQLRLWSQATFGENLLFSPRGGALYLWDPGLGATPAFGTRGVAITGTDVPSRINEIMVSDSTRIVIAFGCNDYGTYNSTPLDPMLIRWTAQESYTDWTPSATNQAGSYRLSHGSEIIGALQARQEILVWTDAAVYSMQYLGPPYVWGFTLMADNISIASPNAMTTAAGVVYWMGTDKFYAYSGRVETLPCSVRQYVFSNINRDQEAQFFAGTNEGYSEVWWFYCSTNSTVADRYVIFNYLDRVWYYGALERTAWLDSPLRQFPMGATSNNLIVFHESAVDDGSTNPPSPINAYIQSSDFDIGDGHNYGFVWRMIPDITFDGSNTSGATTVEPSVLFTVRPRQNPGSRYSAAVSPTVASTQSYRNQSTYTVQEFTEIVYTRVRGRQMAFRISSDSLGTQWQLGVPRIDVRPDGRR